MVTGFVGRRTLARPVRAFQPRLLVRCVHPRCRRPKHGVNERSSGACVAKKGPLESGRNRQ
jgi:hypothetical protein